MIGSATMRRMVHKIVVRILDGLPDMRLQDLLARVATRRAKSLLPANGLRFLFNLDTALYNVEGELAVAYGDGVHTKHRHMRYHDFFVSRIRAEERVLDIGCGIGEVAYDVAKKAGVYVVGIDQNADNIAMARSRCAHPRVSYLMGDVLKDLPNERFNVVLLSNVLEHLKERPAFLRRVKEATQASRFLIRVPLFERDWRVPLKKELGVEWKLDLTHETEYTLESFSEEMVAAGLKIMFQEVRWGEIWAEVVN